MKNATYVVHHYADP